MAAMRFHQGKVEQALDFANQGLRASLEKREKDRELLSYHALAEIYLLKRDPIKAHNFLEKAYLLNDSLRNILNIDINFVHLHADHVFDRRRDFILDCGAHFDDVDSWCYYNIKIGGDGIIFDHQGYALLGNFPAKET